MKPEDLRIGNLVTLDEKQRKEFWDNLVDASNEYFSVVDVYSDGDVNLQLDDEIVDLDIKDISPIPLTEEWLLKFGFKKKDFINESHWDITPQITYVLDYGYILFKGTLFNQANINQVHQLQNLYKALTNQELKII